MLYSEVAMLNHGCVGRPELLPDVLDVELMIELDGRLVVVSAVDVYCDDTDALLDDETTRVAVLLISLAVAASVCSH
jgi:hypothetical protein